MSGVFSFRRHRAFLPLLLALVLSCAGFGALILSAADAPAADTVQPAAPAATFTVTLPLVGKGIQPVAAIRRVESGSLSPLNGTIVSGQSVTVEVELLSALTGVQVTLTPGGGTAQNVTGQFAGLESTGKARTTLSAAPGDYSLTVAGIRAGTPVSDSAGVILLGSQDNTVSQKSFAATTDGDLSALHESSTILLLFPETATLDAITAVLVAYGLHPLDIDLSLKLVRAQLPAGVSPADMTLRLRGDSRVDAAGPNFALAEEPAAGERYPTRLTATYKAGSDATCAGAGGTNRGCFDHSGDADDELKIFRYHFFLDTFAGHRLVETFVPAASLTTTIAIIDTGVTIAGANPLDIPASQFVNITPLPAAFNNSGGVIGGPFGLAAVADGNGHGTSVIAAAAGRGTTTLGTGMHLRVRPVRHAGANFYAALATGLAGLARDKDVVAINGSFGTGSMDLFEPYWDNNSNNNYDFGEPFTDLSGDGVWTNRDGVISPWERLWVLNNIVPTAQPVFSRAFNRLMNPFVDQNSNSLYDAGEPFADTNGNGVYDGAGDGKIYVASGGNDGTSYGIEIYPKVLGPPHTRARTAADFLLMVVSNSQTEDDVRGAEQLRHSSNYGPQTSVAAPGGRVILPDNTGTLAPRSGTSFSAPHVTGLAGEMIYLDQHTNAPASRLSPLQIISMIEATADDLGTTVGGDGATRANDVPGNGPDIYFGHGRINVWKAILAVINRGIAAESHKNAATAFPALTTIDEPNTKWYGLKVHAPIRGSTLWIDGVQVTDAGSSAPGGVNAYAGVRTDRTIRIGVPGEDPTSGVVPMGSESDFLITVSVERADLYAAKPKTLQLRRPGQTAGDAPFFVLELKLQDMRDGKVPGVVFDDFVFEITPPDFGDASASPTSLADDGARHLHFQMEYFGKANAFYSLEAVSPEHKVIGVPDPDGITNWGTDLEDLDGYDDGVTLYPLKYKPGGTGRADVQVCVAETGPRYDANERDRQLFVNGWMDWNTNGRWEESGGEHFLDGLRLAPISPTVAGWAVRGVDSGTVSLLSSNSDCGLYKVEFKVPDKIGLGHLQARFRLDYGENVGRHANSTFTSSSTLSQTAGAAYYGEVEDYIIGPDFGDAGPDKPWPTTRDSDGPRHLSFYREWIGAYNGGTPRASREPDACGTLGSDMDGVDNLGDNCSNKNLDGMDDFRVSIPKPGTVRVEFDVSSGIQGYGFDGSNAGVQTLASDCSLVPLGATPETPAHQRVKMRYDAGNGAERLYVNIFADWDGDGSFETHLLSGPVDPESFGANGAYTLGEPFTDSNGDGVWNSGEGFTDVAGAPTKSFSCDFAAPVPPGPGVTQWVRLRLDWGENATGAMRGEPFEEEPLHVGKKELGGAVWGEVEDAPLTGGPPHRTWTVPVTPGVPVTTGAIPTEGLGGDGPYSFRLVTDQVTIDGMANTPLPPGLTLDTITGQISGVTLRGGEYHPLVETLSGEGTPTESVVALEWFNIPVPVQITTHLLNQVTGRPIPNKEMRLFTSSDCTGTPVATANTDARGRVEFANLEPVTYTVQLPPQGGVTGVGNTCQGYNLELFRAITRTIYFTQTLPGDGGSVQLPLFGALWGTKQAESKFYLLQGGATVTFGPRQQTGEEGFIDVELTDLHLQGWNSPTDFIDIRESPIQGSLGQIKELPGSNFRIDSFFDVWTEVSFDGGQTWTPSEQATRHQDSNPADAFPPEGATLTGQDTTYGPPSGPVFVEIFKSIIVLDPTAQTFLFLGLEQGE